MKTRNSLPFLDLLGHAEILDLKALTPLPRLELDLGCGKGGFSLELARRHPDTLVLAADIKAGRLKKVGNKAVRQKLDNVRTMRCLGWELIAFQIPDACLDRVHVLCPDPWPKDKHRRHRMLSSEFLQRLSNKLKPGGIFHYSTDDLPYLARVRESIAPLKCWIPCDDGIVDMADVKTEFELLWEREGKSVTHLTWRKA